MDWSSWFRRSVSGSSGNKKDTPNPNQQIQKLKVASEEEGEEVFGVTKQLINHVKGFNVETFKNFLHPDEGTAPTTAATSDNVQKDLSEWQERHATLILSKVKELSQLRFMLCPRHMKEQKFWRIYFMLVKSYVAESELRAIRLAKLKQMAMENGEPSNTGTIEVEMAETRQAMSLAPSSP